MEALRVKLKQNCCFLPRFVFRCLGISVEKNEGVVYKLYSYVMVAVAAVYPWSSLHVLLTNMDNFELVANAVFNCVGGLSAFFKLVVMLYNRKQLRKTMDKIEKIQEERNVEKWSQSEIYSLNKKVLVAMVLFYLSLLYFHVGTLVRRLTIKDGNLWKTPISDVSIINITYSPNFEIAWSYSVVGVTLVASAYCITDFLVAAIIVDLTLQFKIFQHTIKKVFNEIQGELIENQQVPSSNWVVLQPKIKRMVVYHLSLINLVEETEKVCSHLVFHDVTGSACVICFSVYYASVLPPLDFKALQCYLEITMLTSSLFFTCYCGSEISRASESVADACYETNFTGTDVRFQKSLLLIMRRSQRPVKITVGRFANLSIPVFVWMVRSTYSYFMVLRKNNENQLNMNL